MPIPFIVNNFSEYYEQQRELEQFRKRHLHEHQLGHCHVALNIGEPSFLSDSEGGSHSHGTSEYIPQTPTTNAIPTTSTEVVTQQLEAHRPENREAHSPGPEKEPIPDSDRNGHTAAGEIRPGPGFTLVTICNENKPFIPLRRDNGGVRSLKKNRKYFK